MEVNFDGIVGPTHTFGGLSDDDMASMQNKHLPSNPKEAALQGLAKMKVLHELGIKQGVLPPQERPFIPILRRLGYGGSDFDVIEKVYQNNPSLYAMCCSSSSMWAANSATVSPSADSEDRLVHFTPANLLSKFHRSFEPSTTGKILRHIFHDPRYFIHHPPLPYHLDYADEGAANHTRLCGSFEQPGIQLFVFGRSSQEKIPIASRFFPRQTKEASQAISRLHALSADRIVFAQQNPAAIDAGVFHNDVISVGNQSVFFYHEEAFIETEKTIEALRRLLYKECQVSLVAIQVSSKEISLSEAVKTYLFNSQLITLPDHTMALIVPKECEKSLTVKNFLQTLLSHEGEHPIRHVIYQDVRQSMRNGGGPACLRLRVVLQPEEFDAIHHPVLFTTELYEKLVCWIEKNYREQLTFADCADPLLLQESRQALDELTGILQLGSLYSFQK